MPVSLKKIPESGALALHALCEVCGAPANFGSEVNIRVAFNCLEKGDKLNAQKLLGKWHCDKHRA